VADYPEIKEIDINPLLVSPEEVIALDARIIADRALLQKKAKTLRTSGAAALSGRIYQKGQDGRRHRNYLETHPPGGRAAVV